MKQSLFKFRPRISISFYVFLVVLILILPLNLLFIDSSKRASLALISQTQLNMDTMLSIYANDLSSRANRTTYFLNNIMSNNSYMKTVFRQTGDENYKLCKYILSQALIESSAQQNEGDIYYIYSPSLSDLLVVKRSGLTSISGDMIREFLNEKIANTYTSEWQLVTIEGEDFLIRSSQNHGLYVGSLIRLDPIIHNLETEIDYPFSSLGYLGENEVLQGSNDSIEGTEEISGTSVSIFCTVLKADALSGLSFFQKYTSSISLSYLLLIPLLYLFLIVFMIRPLNIILDALKKMKAGNQEYRIEDRYNAIEFQQINHSFNSMADSIHDLTISNYEQELARQQVELDNLQLTIRPHFLQNTFGILFSLCQIGNNDQLSHFILYLSDYFRYIYSGVHQLSSFDSELYIIKGYIEIAKVQYPDRFHIQYDLPENYDKIFVPPLLIHNFIENIFSHALKNDSVIHITLELRIEEQTAIFVVTDDGLGIPPQHLHQINQGRTVTDHSRTHVGLYNSWQRIDKIYHGEGHMHVSSTLGRGTSIEIHIPVTYRRD